MKNKALFLDRDGVINYDKGYTHKWDPHLVIDGIIELILKFQSNGFLILIVTNQSGIGRGYFREQDLKQFMNSMIIHFQKFNASIDGYFYCRCNPDNSFCTRRKPEPGMLFDAAVKFDIDLNKSVMLGDKKSDMVAGNRAGLKHLFLFNPQVCGGLSTSEGLKFQIINSFSDTYINNIDATKN